MARFPYPLEHNGYGNLSMDKKLTMQLNKTAGEIEILCDYETKTAVRLKFLIPEWWSTGKAGAKE